MRRTAAVRCNNPSPSDDDDDADPRLPTRPAAPMAISWPQQQQYGAVAEAGIFCDAFRVAFMASAPL
jgi:hypothetical protein